MQVKSSQANRDTHGTHGRTYRYVANMSAVQYSTFSFWEPVLFCFTSSLQLYVLYPGTAIAYMYR